MAKYTFTSDLSVKGIKNLQKQLRNYKDKILPKKIEMFMQELANEGVKIAKANIVDYDAIFTGELLASIKSVNGGKVGDKIIFYIVADSKHAAWVEFGTGQLGLESPYPSNFPEGVNWEYNTGQTIQQATEDIYVGGYSEPYIQAGDYFWVYIGEQDGKLHISKGMPSRPFMLNTSHRLEEICVSTAKKVFAKK